MASTNNLLEMLENPDFKMLVAEIFAVVAKSQESGATANVACDALQYVNALICETSHPFRIRMREVGEESANGINGQNSFEADQSC